MSHEVNGRIATIRPSWHGLDNILTEEESRDLEIIIRKGNLDYEIKKALIRYDYNGMERDYPGQFVAYNSKTGAALGTVSRLWRTPQPRECVEFYKELVEDQGWYIETAGSLKQGAAYWCMANNGITGTIGKNDRAEGRVYIATGIGMPTIVDNTLVNIVCFNTLSYALRNSKDSGTAVRVIHKTDFDADAVKAQLGLINYQKEFNQLIEIGNEATKFRVSDDWVKEYVAQVVTPGSEIKDEDGNFLKPRLVNKVSGYFNDSPGSNLPEREGTLWGAINAVTYWTDHERTRNDDARGVELLYGTSRTIKAKALDLAMEYMEAA